MESEQGLTAKVPMINNKEGINPKTASIGENASLPVGTEPVARRKKVLQRKLHQAPRYFDPPEYNTYGINKKKFKKYKARRRKARCYICGDRDHEGKLCKKVTACLICSKKGHLIINCPKKNVKVDLTSGLCLKCGSIGHDMFLCTNNYDSEDLKAIECYICKKSGHLCCVDDETKGQTKASCYKCGLSGHFGSECSKPDEADVNPGAFCNKCKVRGHYDRQCPKKAQGKTPAEKAAVRTEKRKARRARRLKKNKPNPTVDENQPTNTNLTPIVNQNQPDNTIPTPIANAYQNLPNPANPQNQPNRTIRTPIVDAFKKYPKRTNPHPLGNAYQNQPNNTNPIQVVNAYPNRPNTNPAPIANAYQNQPNSWSRPPFLGPYYGQSGSNIWIPPAASTSLNQQMGPGPGPGPLPSHQQHINYHQLGTQDLNPPCAPTHFPHHLYSNSWNGPQIRGIPFNQEPRTMVPRMGSGMISGPATQPPVSTWEFQRGSQNFRPRVNHQTEFVLPRTDPRVPLNSTVLPTQFPYVFQNNSRQPIGHHTEMGFPLAGTHEARFMPPRHF
ncbi:hypothetical protein OROMI_002221 [Orobanche minor]